MRRPLIAGAVALCALLSAGPATAGLEVGAEAPSFESGNFVNTEPVTIAELSGRLIFLELWKTT